MTNKKFTNIFTITITDKDTEQRISRDYNMDGISKERLGEIIRDMLDMVVIHSDRIPF